MSSIYYRETCVKTFTQQCANYILFLCFLMLCNQCFICADIYLGQVSLTKILWFKWHRRSSHSSITTCSYRLHILKKFWPYLLFKYLMKIWLFSGKTEKGWIYIIYAQDNVKLEHLQWHAEEDHVTLWKTLSKWALSWDWLPSSRINCQAQHFHFKWREIKSTENIMKS